MLEGSHLPLLASGVHPITPEIHLPGSRAHSILLAKVVYDAQAGLGKEGGVTEATLEKGSCRLFDSVQGAAAGKMFPPCSVTV